MFSIVICDENRNITYLVRDRFGIKPLYYCHDKKNKELTFVPKFKACLKIKKLTKYKIILKHIGT